MRLAYWTLAAVLVMLAVLFGLTDDLARQRTLGIAFGIVLAAGMFLSAAIRSREGDIRLKRRKVSRATHPGRFWTAVVLLRILPGALLLVGSVWLLLDREPM